MSNLIKSVLRKLLLVVMAILMFSWIITMVGEPLRRPSFMVRHYVFMLTPRGTHMDDVRAFIGNAENLRVVSSSYEQGFRRTRVDQSIIVGDKHIRASVRRPGSSPFVAMSIYWGFDDNSNLVDVHVRTTIGP